MIREYTVNLLLLRQIISLSWAQRVDRVHHSLRLAASQSVAMEKMMARTVLSRPSVNARCDTVVNGEPSVRTGFAPKALTLRVGDLFELLPSCDFSMGFSFSRSCVQAVR